MTTDNPRVWYRRARDWRYWNGICMEKAGYDEIRDAILPGSTVPMPQAPVMQEADHADYTRFRNQIDSPTWEEEGIANIVAISYSELSEDNRQALASRMLVCDINQREWKWQKECLADLRTWIRDSVDPSLRPVLCPLEEDVKQWYARIYDHAAPFRAREVEIITEEYHEHLAAIPKSLHRLSDWRLRWESLMSQGKAVGVAECSQATSWFPSFIRALRKVPALELWVEAIDSKKRGQFGVLCDDLKYRDVSNELNRVLYRIPKTALPVLHSSESSEEDYQERSAPRRHGERGSRFTKTNLEKEAEAIRGCDPENEAGHVGTRESESTPIRELHVALALVTTS